MTLEERGLWLRHGSSLPGVVGAVVGVDGESGIVADEAARHGDRVEAARLQLRQKLAVEAVNVLDVAEERRRLLRRQRRPVALLPPVIQVTLSNENNHFNIF